MDPTSKDKIKQEKSPQYGRHSVTGEILFLLPIDLVGTSQFEQT